MKQNLQQWLLFLNITDTEIATLHEFNWLIKDNMNTLLDTVYQHIIKHDTAANLFKSPASLRRARELQKRHWLNNVFAGKFNDDYLDSARAIGYTHYRLGVNLLFFVSTYYVVLNQFKTVIQNNLGHQTADAARLTTALNQVIFLDMGLTSSVYYDSVVAGVEEMAHELISSLARAGEYRDNETGQHIKRMSYMCHALAKATGQDEKWCKMILLASPLHDIGKIGIPDHILLKQGDLNSVEKAIMNSHPAIGGEIISDHPSEVILMAKRIALTHHERWDGTGYPIGLKGEEIPLEGRIATICDVYDALVSKRPYKPAWSREKALAYIQENSGRYFDPNLVDRFLSIQPAIERIQAEFREAVQK